MKHWVLILYMIAFAASGFIGGLLIGRKNPPRPPHSKVYSVGMFQTQEASANQIVVRVDPTYPESALKDKVGGTVWIGVDMNESGTVDRVDVVKSVRKDLDSAAAAAAAQWKFKPMTVGDQPVKASVMIPFAFGLDSSASNQKGHMMITSEVGKRTVSK